MIQQREKDFEQNYSVLTFASAVTFTIFFIGFIFILNLTYLPITIKNNGLSGILILFAYYFLTSIVLAPVLIVLNGILGLGVKKIMKLVYTKQPVLGFIIFPAIMTIIPFIMTYAVHLFMGNISKFDYYFIYITTWISTIFQYMWILKNIDKSPEEKLTQKQINFLKKTDQVDYF